ncbi:MAG: PEP-CTERM sorting domain-containing protein [Acidobacteria bacterium]|nr:PEP-CTERM sorting domain-containing protein [Acidobacteriota bacterium]
MTIVSSTGGDVGGLGLPALVSGNILRSFSGWLSEDGDPSFQISFATPVTDFSATFAGISTASAVRVFSYNGSTLLDTAAAVAGTGQQVISVSGVGLITSVKVTPGSFDDWVGVDNIAFTPSESAPVPEPSTFVAMALGLTVVSLSRLRRRAKR